MGYKILTEDIIINIPKHDSLPSIYYICTADINTEINPDMLDYTSNPITLVFDPPESALWCRYSIELYGDKARKLYGGVDINDTGEYRQSKITLQNSYGVSDHAIIVIQAPDDVAVNVSYKFYYFYINGTYNFDDFNMFPNGYSFLFSIGQIDASNRGDLTDSDYIRKFGNSFVSYYNGISSTSMPHNSEFDYIFNTLVNQNLLYVLLIFDNNGKFVSFNTVDNDLDMQSYLYGTTLPNTSPSIYGMSDGHYNIIIPNSIYLSNKGRSIISSDTLNDIGNEQLYIYIGSPTTIGHIFKNHGQWISVDKLSSCKKNYKNICNANNGIA